MKMPLSKARCHQHHVLIVDDEEIVLVALRETLRQLGFQVTTASDAMLGLAQIQRERFALVITDHQMPKLTGLEFLSQVRNIQPDASRVLISAVLNLGTMIDAINRAEVFRFLIKPWQRANLLETIDAALHRFEMINGLHRRLEQSQIENDSLLRRLARLEQELQMLPAQYASKTREPARTRPFSQS
jgi:DNA-binding NtrC family response regulator